MHARETFYQLNYMRDVDVALAFLIYVDQAGLELDRNSLATAFQVLRLQVYISKLTCFTAYFTTRNIILETQGTMTQRPPRRWGFCFRDVESTRDLPMEPRAWENSSES